MSSMDLVKSVKEFLEATSNECYQPGEKADKARSNLIHVANLEEQFSQHGLNAHTYPNYNCEKCSKLLNHLESLLNNPPQLVNIDGKDLGSYHITSAYQEAIKEVISFVNTSHPHCCSEKGCGEQVKGLLET